MKVGEQIRSQAIDHIYSILFRTVGTKFGASVCHMHMLQRKGGRDRVPSHQAGYIRYGSVTNIANIPTTCYVSIMFLCVFDVVLILHIKPAPSTSWLKDWWGAE